MLIDIVAIAFALFLAALGVWRGFVRELLVSLAGIVLGVFAGSLWSTAWGADWAGRLGADPRVFQGVIGLASLFLIVIFIGYGSALFLPRRKPNIWQRLAGGVVGLVNGLFLAAFSFNYIQNHFFGSPPPADSVLMRAPLASAMIKWQPLVLAGLLLIVFLAVVVVALVRLFRYIRQLVAEAPAAPAPQPLTPAPALPSTPMAPPPQEPSVPCPNCGSAVPFGATLCPQCGKTIS